MARLLGISQPTYVQKELGNRPFTQWEIERLLKTFRKKYEEIFAPAERRVNLRDIAWKD
jgi:DNA-binding XRE family transcriptional regulator